METEEGTRLLGCGSGARSTRLSAQQSRESEDEGFINAPWEPSCNQGSLWRGFMAVMEEEVI